jgi:hypothetical protein
MPGIVNVLMWASALASGQDIAASTSPFSVDTSQALAPDNRFFLAGFAIDSRNGRWAVEIYSGEPTADGLRSFTARRSLWATSGPEQMSWADSRTCPALMDVVISLNEQQPVTVRLPLTPRTPLSVIPDPPIDGSGYWIWGRARQTDGGLASTVTSTNSGEIARWVAAATRYLEGCWQPMPQAD